MVRIWWIWFLLLIPCAGDPLTATGRLPLRPSDGIYDPEGWLEAPMRAEMVRQILAAREKGDTVIFVVVLEEKPDDHEALMERLGSEWGKGGLWGVILHVAGGSDYPKILGGLSRTPKWSEEQLVEFDESLQRALGKVSRDFTKFPDERVRLAHGARELSVELGYLALVMERMDHHNSQARGDRVDSKEKGNQRGPAWMPVIIVGVVLVLLTIFGGRLLFGKKSEEATAAFLFPEVGFQKRFRAPWSGGSDVLVEFRKLRRHPDRDSSWRGRR